jgi:hypothetical protein
MIPALALLAACDGDNGTGPCPATDVQTLVAVPSLQVTVVDSASGTDLTRTAQGWFVSAGRTDELAGSALGGPLYGYGPAGRYSVIVQHEGYRTWGRDDIRVRAGECGPITEEITVRMAPAGGIRASD